MKKFPMIYVRPGKEKLAVKVNVIRFNLGRSGWSKESRPVFSSRLKRRSAIRKQKLKLNVDSSTDCCDI